MKSALLIIFSIIFFIVLVGLIFNHYFPSGGTVTEGQLWSSKKYGNQYLVSIKNQSELVAALTDFVEQQHITAGTISGIGAVNHAVLRFFDPSTKKYVDETFNGQMEITNLSGNISTKDGKEYLHLHVTLGNNQYQGLAGHLLSATISGAGEFWVASIPGAKVERTYHPEIGLNFYDFKK